MKDKYTISSINTILILLLFIWNPAQSNAQWIESEFPLRTANEGNIVSVTHDLEKNIYAVLREDFPVSQIKKFNLLGDLLWSKSIDYRPDEIFTNDENDLFLIDYFSDSINIYEVNKNSDQVFAIFKEDIDAMFDFDKYGTAVKIFPGNNNNLIVSTSQNIQDEGTLLKTYRFDLETLEIEEVDERNLSSGFFDDFILAISKRLKDNRYQLVFDSDVPIYYMLIVLVIDGDGNISLIDEEIVDEDSYDP